MKKILSVILALSMCLTLGVLLTACGHEHTWDEVWDTDETSHWHICTGEECTEVSDKGDHEWDAGEITSAPSATADGVKTFKCKVCGEAKKEPVKAKTDVTAEEWETALKMDAENYAINITLVKKEDDQRDERTQTIRKNGTTIWMLVSYTEMVEGEEGELVSVEKAINTYYATEGGKYYKYVMADGETTKNEVEKAEYDAAFELGFNEFFKYAAFTYENNEYKAASAENDLKDIVIKFVDGKLAIMNYTQELQSAKITSEMVVEYDKVPDIILPTVE